VLGDTNQFDPRAQGSEGSGSVNLRQAWASGKFNRLYTGVEKREPTFIGADGSITHRFRHGIYLRAHSEITWMTDAAIRRSLAQHRPLISSGVALGYEWRR